MDEAYQISDRVLVMDKGNKVLEGAPQALLEEHMESHVLELIDPSKTEVVEHPGLDGRIRKESSGERVLYYGHDLNELQRMTQALTPGQYYLRQVNLEDLFMKVTGRSLNELQ
jgi:lipooligosaccharide transport system ATP-binding protein